VQQVSQTSQFVKFFISARKFDSTYSVKFNG